MRIILKFGGSSLANPERIRAAAGRAAALKRQGHQPVVVVSAQGDTTDHMIARAKDITEAPTDREMDSYLSAGEQMSAALFAMALEDLGCPAVSLNGIQAGILTDGVHGNARVLGLGNHRLEQELAAGRIPVVTGFQGIGRDGDITTLGRGGSDTTAVALAAFLSAEECRIYTDVDGVYDRDPRKFPDAVWLPWISWDDMLALARQGAQVLHDRSVELAKAHGVGIRVLSSFRPGPGTMVSGRWEDSCQI